MKKNEWLYNINECNNAEKTFFSNTNLTFFLTVLIGLSYSLAYIYFISEFIYYGIPLEFLDIGAKEVIFTIFLLITPLPAIAIVLLIDFRFLRNKGDSLNIYSIYKDSYNNLKKSIKNLYTTYKDIYLDNKSINEHEERLLGNDEHKRIQIHLIYLKELKIWNRKNLLINILIALILLLIPLILIVVSPYLLMNSKNDFINLVGSSLLLSSILYTGVLLLPNKNKNIKLILFLLFFLFLYAFSSPYIQSGKKENFIIFEKNEIDVEEDFVVLTIYENNFVYVPRNKETNKIEKTFNLIPINEVENFNKESIGRIKVN